jgi:hypothetical protein
MAAEMMANTTITVLGIMMGRVVVGDVGDEFEPEPAEVVAALEAAAEIAGNGVKPSLPPKRPPPGRVPPPTDVVAANSVVDVEELRELGSLIVSCVLVVVATNGDFKTLVVPSTP